MQQFDMEMRGRERERGRMQIWIWQRPFVTLETLQTSSLITTFFLTTDDKYDLFLEGNTMKLPRMQKRRRRGQTGYRPSI